MKRRRIKLTRERKHRLATHPVCRELRRIRVGQQIAVADLADRVGSDRYTIGRWERGEMSPTLFNLTNWCDALGYTVGVIEKVDQP